MIDVPVFEVPYINRGGVDVVASPYSESYVDMMFLSHLPTPPLGQDMTQGQFFKRSLTGLNSEFSFS